jgi:Ty3 transposon capsid-like protein
VLQQQLEAQQEANAALQQQFAALQEHNAALNQQMQQMQHFMMQHLANQQQQAHPPEHPITRALLRTPARQFSGHDGDRKDVDNWLFDMHQRFRAMRPVPDDDDKITYAVQHLAGPAKTWYRTHSQLLLTWDVFEEAFRDHYELHNKDGNAAIRLKSIKQTGRLSQYTTDFNNLVLLLPGIPNSVLRDIYIDGLNPSIRRVVKATQEGLDLAGAQAKAARLDDVDNQEAAILRQLHRNSTVRPELPRQRGNGSSSSGPTPMDLGAMRLRRHGMYVPPRLTPQWHNRHTARLSTGSRAIMQAVTAGPYSSNRPSGNHQGSGQARWGERRQGANPQGAAARFPQSGNGQRRRQ